MDEPVAGMPNDQRIRQCVEDYVALIEEYLSGDLSARHFEERYWPMRRRWLDEGVEPPYEVRGSLDSDVDAFALNLQDIAWHEIDEPTLRARVEEASTRLRQWLAP